MRQYGGHYSTPIWSSGLCQFTVTPTIGGWGGFRSSIGSQDWGFGQGGRAEAECLSQIFELFEEPFVQGKKVRGYTWLMRGDCLFLMTVDADRQFYQRGLSGHFIMSSTRRLSARPFSLSLVDNGTKKPAPAANILPAATLC